MTTLLNSWLALKLLSPTTCWLHYAYINCAIARRAFFPTRCRYREPERRQRQIHICHAHHCGTAKSWKARSLFRS